MITTVLRSRCGVPRLSQTVAGRATVERAKPPICTDGNSLPIVTRAIQIRLIWTLACSSRDGGRRNSLLEHGLLDSYPGDPVAWS